MSDKMKAIETVYRGWKFRSRLEARWAVFFDALGMDYQYEPEGFELGDGMRYLPDFFFPNAAMWVEIKPSIQTPVEREKVIRLCLTTRQTVFILAGDVWSDVRIMQFHPLSDEDKESIIQGQKERLRGFYWLSPEEGFFSGSSGDPRGIDLQRGYIWTFPEWQECPHCHNIGLSLSPTFHHGKDYTCSKPASNDEGCLERAFTAARQARFEHGEKP